MDGSLAFARWMQELRDEEASGILRCARGTDLERFGFRRGLIVGSPREAKSGLEGRLCRVVDTIDAWQIEFDREICSYPPGFLPTVDAGAWARQRIASELCPEEIEGLILRWSSARFFGDGINGVRFEELVVLSQKDPAEVVLQLCPLVMLGRLKVETEPADRERLRKVYRARARSLHPDAHPTRDVRLQSEQLAALSRAFRDLLPRTC